MSARAGLNVHPDRTSRQTWATPRVLVEAIDALASPPAPVDLDVCAEAWSAKATRYLGPGSTLGLDGLAAPWSEHSLSAAWCNPPFNAIAPWVEKAILELGRGVRVRLLVPPRTDCGWYHRLVEGEGEWAHRSVLGRRVAFEPPEGVVASSPPGPVELWTLAPRRDLPRVIRWAAPKGVLRSPGRGALTSDNGAGIRKA